MTTWNEIRDEVAGMLADGKPLEDVIAKLEKRKNEMAKAELIAVFDELKKPKPMTNEEYLRSLNTEQLAETILQQWIHGAYHGVGEFGLTDKEIESARDDIVEWLKEIHK